MFNKLFNEAAPDGAVSGGAGGAVTTTSIPIVNTPAATAAAPAVQQKWPETWRADMSGGDEKEIKQLERYATPADIWRKARALEQRLSSGELKSALPKDATEDQVKQWRAENGIPESIDKYDIKFDEDMDDADKARYTEVLKFAHESNLTNSQAQRIIEGIKEVGDKRAEERQAKDHQLAQATQDALRAEFGPDYRQNINMIHGLLDTAPQGVKQKLLGGRMADGTPIGSDAAVLKFLATLARQINPVTTLVPGAGANIAGAIDDEMSKLEKMMGNRGSEYWKGPTADKMQARYRELAEAKSRTK